jgi:hypothetical protein
MSLSWLLQMFAGPVVDRLPLRPVLVVSQVLQGVVVLAHPLGSLVGGVVAETLGTTTTMGVAAFGFGFTGLFLLVRPRLLRLHAVTDATPEAFGVTVSADRDGA